MRGGETSYRQAPGDLLDIRAASPGLFAPPDNLEQRLVPGCFVKLRTVAGRSLWCEVAGQVEPGVWAGTPDDGSSTEPIRFEPRHVVAVYQRQER